MVHDLKASKIRYQKGFSDPERSACAEPAERHLTPRPSAPNAMACAEWRPRSWGMGCAILRDMAEYFGRLYSLRDEIDQRIAHLHKRADSQAPLDREDCEYVGQAARQLEKFFRRYGFKVATAAEVRIQNVIRDDQRRREFTAAHAGSRLNELWDDFIGECGERYVEIVASEKSRFYDSGVSPSVDLKFSEATKEIKEAGACYALERNTAAIFHLMRAAEYGARALAVSVGVAVGGTVPLEYETWGKLAKNIKDRIDAVGVNQWSAPARSNFLAFYSGSLADFVAFKDECRNLLMHTRSGLYNQHEAASWQLK